MGEKRGEQKREGEQVRKAVNGEREREEESGGEGAEGKRGIKGSGFR